MHPGHLRFLKFASEQGSRLVVGLLAKEYSLGAFLSNEERKESLESVAFVDEVVLIRGDLKDVVLSLKPASIIKGHEFENADNEELAWLNQYGGQLLFGSGEPATATHDYLKQDQKLTSDDVLSEHINYKSLAYIDRHQISLKQVKQTLDCFASKRIAVIGDTIIDQYVQCDPVGMSREDATIVVSPNSESHFLGGAGIVAGHAAGLGAQVDFYTVLGNDELCAFVEAKCGEYDINLLAFSDSSRPTTSKKRYRAGSKTLLRVNNFRQHAIQKKIRDEIIASLMANIDDYDLIVLSDFSYGVLCRELLTQLLPELVSRKVKVVADSQSSSQVGDLNKFVGATLVTPTEYEARQAMKNHHDGLIKISESLGESLASDHVFITQGEDGVLIRSRNAQQGWWDTDDLPALNKNAKDVAGAGDAMMIAASLSLCCEEDIWLAALLGSVASALQVSRVGNVPLDYQAYSAQFDALFDVK